MGGKNIHRNFCPQLPRDKSPPIGCIGSGFIMADCHLVAYRKGGFNPVRIASRTLTHARQGAERHSLTPYATYQEMLASGTVEVVDIAVPPDAQLDVIKNVCRYKQHVRGILAQKHLAVY